MAETTDMSITFNNVIGGDLSCGSDSFATHYATVFNGLID